MVLAEKPFFWSAKTFPVPFFSCSCSCRARQGKFCKFFALTLAMLLVTIFYCFVEVTVFEKELYIEPAKESSLIEVLSAVASLPPHTPVSDSCQSPPQVSLPDCQGDPGLTGSRLQKPRRVALLLLFAFEVDTLEVALREQEDLVDHIFLVESRMSHKGTKKAAALGNVEGHTKVLLCLARKGTMRICKLKKQWRR